MRIKETLVSLLALNSVCSLNLEASRVEQIGNKITKNLEQGQESSKQYKVLEDILRERSKELKDLYLQSDYIVKPEYLEWQIFFSGFYSNSHRKSKMYNDEKSEKESNIKSINLGMSIPINDIKREDIALNIDSILGPGIKIDYTVPVAPKLTVPVYSTASILGFSTPSVYARYTYRDNNTNPKTVGIVTDNVQYNTTGNRIFENLNANSGSGINLDVNNLNMGISGSAVSYENGSVVGTTSDNYNHTGYYTLDGSNFSIHNISINGDYEIKGDWNLKITDYDSLYGTFGFLGYKPYHTTGNNKVTFSGNLFLQNDSITTHNFVGYGNLFLVGLSLDLSDDSPNVYNAILENTGTITIKDGQDGFQSNIGMQFIGDRNSLSYGELINSGEIIIESIPTVYTTSGYASTGILIDAYKYVYEEKLNKGLIKSGDIKVLGEFNSGIMIRNSTGIGDFSGTDIQLDGSGGLITLGGKQNIGLVIDAALSSTGNSVLDNVKNISVLLDGESNIGIYRATTTSNTPVYSNMPLVLNDSNIKNIEFGENSRYSVGIMTGGSTTIIDSSLQNSLKPLNSGSTNALIVNNGQVKNYMPIYIGSGASSAVALLNQMGTFENYADIQNNSSNGTSIYSRGTFLNKGNIEANGGNAKAIIVEYGDFTSENDYITVNGKSSISVYGASTAFETPSLNIKTDKIELTGEKSATIFSNGADISLGSKTAGQNMKMEVSGNESVGFYNKINYKKYGKLTLTSDIDVDIKDGAYGFYYVGTGKNNSFDLFSQIDTTNGALKFNVDENSYNILMSTTKLDLSTFQNFFNDSKIALDSSAKSKLLYSTFTIDMDSNIDFGNNNGNKTYRNLEISESSIRVTPGTTITGTESGQAGISQVFGWADGSFIENNGEIILSGDNSVGIYSEKAKQDNNGLLNLNGENSVGVFTVGGSLNNIGEINIGNKGVGIYAQADINTEYPLFSSIQISNSGRITASEGENSIGIYLNDNVVNIHDDYFAEGRLLTLNSGSNIDVSASKGGVGIYSNKADIKSSGPSIISIGENGTGIYIKDKEADLSDIELNITGDNSVGIFTDGTASFSGTGTVNLSGKDIIVFNVAGSGNFDQNFNINSTEGSSYNVLNMKNREYYFNSDTALGAGGTFLKGENSAVLLDVDSKLISAGDNMIGIAFKGNYYNNLPVNINGEILDHEATNKGLIKFGNNSIGMYTIDGSSNKNEGEIILGNNSVGQYGVGSTSNVFNTGVLNVGAESVGLYLKDGVNISNSGTIESTGIKTVGIHLDGNSNMSGENTGIIRLSGDKSVGLYIAPEGLKNFNNNNLIEIGDSNSASDPSIGIFNNNSTGTVNNSSDVISGDNSISIYNNGGIINHSSGTLKTGASGTVLYSKSGNVNITGGNIVLNGEKTVGLYGKDNAVITNSAGMYISSESYGVVLNGDVEYTGKSFSTLDNKGVFLYSDGQSTVTNESGADMKMTGSDSAGFYLVNGGTLINKGTITGNNGTGNIGIYNKGGSIDNSGDIKIGDSVIIDIENPFLNKYSVGVYGENLETMKNSGNIEIGAHSVGFYSTNNLDEGLNTGNIDSVSEGAIGIYLEQGKIRNEGNITLSGNDSIGIAGARNSEVTNSGTITMNGNDSIGIYAHANSKVINENTGKIYINGDNSIGVRLLENSILENYGLIEVASGTIGSTQVLDGGNGYTIPSIINAGIIKVDEKFELDGFNLIIKPDPASFRAPTIEEITINGYTPEDINGGFLLSNTVNITAPSFSFGNNTAKIDPLFTQGTNARVYKFENVFDSSTADGGPNTGELAVQSLSLTFDAIPVTNKDGKIDIWMEKIDYDEFTQGEWYDGFAKNIEKKYLNAQGNALKIYDKLDLITDEGVLKNSLEQLSGSMYANIKQREQDIYGSLNNALFILQNSENNTKENVKINVIAGKGSSEDKASGVDSYDYDMVGVLALREVERTYRHTFGYSLGYMRTDFQMKDTKNEDQADTVQVGLHNKYNVNGWKFKNDLLARLSIHNSDRSMVWYDGEKSDLKSDYNVYGVSMLNEAGKEFEIGKNLKIMPYASLELGYMEHDDFEESGGMEALDLEKNSGYSVKPELGLKLESEKELGNNSEWKIKGTVNIGYEYELGDMNNEEKAKLDVIEEGYHKLNKVSDDKGKFKTAGVVGVEIKDRYGIFLTGEYKISDKGEEDYRAGLSLKAVF
ncbi:autotransporter domain-containing protein [Sebaldella termitidis]|uniref:autotransporter domain-containing protein n=1 Tax=Sebaldella termitidis TaxID=826 RepID=UPI003EBF6868